MKSKSSVSLPPSLVRSGTLLVLGFLAILACPQAHADLLVFAGVGSAGGAGPCGPIEDTLRVIVQNDGGEVLYVDQNCAASAVIDERSWELVKRLTIEPKLFNFCDSESLPCASREVPMVAHVSASGRDDFVMKLFEAGGTINSETQTVEGFRFSLSIPAKEAASLGTQPGLLSFLFEGTSSLPPFFDNTLYLGEGFGFRATAEWHTADDTGVAHPRHLTTDTGSFYFFRYDNLELTVKVLDGCSLTGHYWVFASGMTNVGVTLTVEHGEVATTYTNPLGQTFQTITDTVALPCD